MAFERDEGIVVETGLNGDFREEWERIPHSTGRSMVRAELASNKGVGSYADDGESGGGVTLVRVRRRR